MKAIQIHRFGGPEVMELAEIAPPVPKSGEAVVRLDYSGVNFTEVYQRAGLYARSHTYQTPLPMVIGSEGGGTVAALGEGVTGLQVGDRVTYCIVRGSYAEFAAVPAWRLVKIPHAMPMPVATALMLQGFTAHYLSHSAYPLQSGDICLIHAGAGGVGQLLIQMAKMRGATVITTVGSDDKAVIAGALGADHIVRYRDTDFREEVLRLTSGRGVDVVYDAVGRDTIAKSIRSLRKRGLCVNYGGASGLVTAIEPLELAEAGSVFFTRPHLADYIATRDELAARASDLFAAWESGRLKVAIDREYPLTQAADAHRHLENRGTRGKLLLKIH